MFDLVEVVHDVQCTAPRGAAARRVASVVHTRRNLVLCAVGVVMVARGARLTTV